MAGTLSPEYQTPRALVALAWRQVERLARMDSEEMTRRERDQHRDRMRAAADDYFRLLALHRDALGDGRYRP